MANLEWDRSVASFPRAAMPNGLVLASFLTSFYI